MNSSWMCSVMQSVRVATRIGLLTVCILSIKEDTTKSLGLRSSCRDDAGEPIDIFEDADVLQDRLSAEEVGGFLDM